MGHPQTEMQNKANFPHFQSENNGCQKNKAKICREDPFFNRKSNLENRQYKKQTHFLRSWVPGSLCRFTKLTEGKSDIAMADKAKSAAPPALDISGLVP
jgi:hypothetical protein